MSAFTFRFMPHAMLQQFARITHRPVLCSLALLCALTGNAAVPIPEVQPLPYDPGTGPEDRDVAFLAWHEDLAPDGYREDEILMSGTANVYEYVDDAGQSPAVQPTSDPAGAYTTRVLIRRPQNVADFNGVVYLEILNATARYDGAPMWNLTYPSIVADGAAWVGVTYSGRTAQFMRNEWGTDAAPAPPGSQPRNRSRYATLNIPTRAYTWDILNQAAALLRADDDARNPMRGYGVDTIITTGYSQSAAYVTTFANSFYPSYAETAPCTAELAALDQCTPIVNGYIVAAGGPTSRLLDGAGSNPIGDRRNCENALNREMPCVDGETEPPPEDDPLANDLPKIMRFTTESDIKAVRVRQSMADQPLLRTYEVAGASHVDFWGSIVGQKVAEYQFGIPATGTIESSCDLPYNPIRTGIPLSAIQHRLARWIQYDEAPPPSEYMVWEGDFSQSDEFFKPLVNWVRDDGDSDATDGDEGRGDGNVVGGVRPPRINVPLGRYYGSNFLDGPFSTQKIFCTGIIGGFDAYDANELANRYSNSRVFVVLTWWNVWISYVDGFMLPVDAKTIMDEAKAFEGLPAPPG